MQLPSLHQALPQNLYCAAQVRELDRLIIEEHGISGIRLMKRAGRAVLDILLECWPQHGKVTVYCGAGNNGGDGYIVAALAAQQNIPVELINVGDVSKLTGDARRAYDFACAQSVTMHSYELGMESTIEMGGVIVDALLGTGLAGDVREPFKGAIEQINNSGLPVVAVDIPSGLNSDTGAVCGVSVKADLTVSFIALKQGLFTGQGADYAGEIFFNDLVGDWVNDDALLDVVYQQVPTHVKKLAIDDVLAYLTPRSRIAHKGDFGHVLIVGGDKGYGGSVLMAAQMAARSGAGLVSVATQPEHIPALLARQPEIMAQGVSNHHELLKALSAASVLVLGPGLGQTAWSQQMFFHSMAFAQQNNIPVVLDADGLNLLAKAEIIGSDELAKKLPSRLLITPHPREAARLLQSDTKVIQQDRFAAVKQLQEKYRATVVLKGSGTLVYGERSEHISLCPYGNPGMASGGMGDVLSGLLGALLAQGLSTEQAAQLGVCAHAYAADCVAEEGGERGLLASDLIPVVRRLLNSQA